MMEENLSYYNVLRYLHPVGLPITGIVIERQSPTFTDTYPTGYLTLEVPSGIPARLSYSDLVDDYAIFTEDLIPEVGSRVTAVVRNYAGGTLFLSAKPSDFEESTIRLYREFYDCLESLNIGDTIVGTVYAIAHFGIFVDIGLPFYGIIDIGHTRWITGYRLPKDRSAWPQHGEKIRCKIGGFRFSSRQIDLGWLPDDESIRKVESTDSGEP